MDSVDPALFLQHAACILDSFNKDLVSVEDHATAYMEESQVTSKPLQSFLTEMISNCDRYRSIMKVVTDAYYATDGKYTMKHMKSIHTVLCYMVVFQLEKVPLSWFKEMVNSQDVNKMHKFLNFFLDPRNLTTWIKDEWHKCYEPQYVQDKFLSPILSYLPELSKFVESLGTRIENEKLPKKKLIGLTEVKVFDLTQPKPRSVPVPKLIPKMEKSKPPTKFLYKEPKELADLAKSRIANRKKAVSELMEASKRQFSCANPEKSPKIQEKLQTIKAEQDLLLQFNKKKSIPLPSFQRKNAAIRMNTAAILREGKLYKEREDTEIKKMKDLEAGAGNPFEFLNWQQEMKQKELDSELIEIERRKLIGKLSHEESYLAKQNLIRENQQKVREMKEEAQKLMQEYMQKQLEEELQTRKLVDEVIETRESLRENRKKMQDYKHKIVQAMNEEKKELMRKALDGAELEMKKKMKLISQIRAMQAVPSSYRQKRIDFAETAGFQLMCEMSLTELKERLALLKKSQKEEEELKRDEIITSKQAKEQKLLDTLDSISKHRAEQTRFATIRQENKKRSKPQPEVRDEAILELKQKLEEKKVQRVQMRKTSTTLASRSTSGKPPHCSKETKSTDEINWEHLEAAKERTARLMGVHLLSTSPSSLKTSNKIAMAT